MATEIRAGSGGGVPAILTKVRLYRMLFGRRVGNGVRIGSALTEELRRSD